MKREDIILLAPKGGVGIELGVAEGEFANRVCEKKHLSKWYGVDRYTDHHDHKEMWQMLERMEPYKEFTLIRESFDKCLELFDDNYFDIVYVDGYAHTGQENGKTLEDWYPKVKSGGIFSGDDYEKCWGLNFRCINEFVEKYNLELNVVPSTEPNSKWSRHPSWWIKKP